MLQPGTYLLQYQDPRDGYIPQYQPRHDRPEGEQVDPDDLFDIVHQTIILVLSVMLNILGKLVYIIRLEDPVNLKTHCTFELWVDKGLLSMIQLSPEQEQEFLREKLPRGYHVVPEAIQEVPHKTTPTLGSVMSNNIGEHTYGIYMEDAANLKNALGFVLHIRADGKARIEQSQHPTDLILDLHPDLKEKDDQE